MLKAQAPRIQSLAKTEDLAWAKEGEQPAKSAGAALSEVTVFVPLEGLVDFSAEEARLEKELAKLEKDITPSRKKLTNQGFLAKAPEAVVAKEKAKWQRLMIKSPGSRRAWSGCKAFVRTGASGSGSFGGPGCAAQAVGKRLVCA